MFRFLIALAALSSPAMAETPEQFDPITEVHCWTLLKDDFIRTDEAKAFIDGFAAALVVPFVIADATADPSTADTWAKAAYKRACRDNPTASIAQIALAVSAQASDRIAGLR